VGRTSKSFGADCLLHVNWVVEELMEVDREAIIALDRGGMVPNEPARTGRAAPARAENRG